MESTDTTVSMLPTINQRVEHLSFDQVTAFSTRDRAYVNADSRLRPFYKYSVELEAFAKVIADKSKEMQNRELLVEVLKNQYSHFEDATPTLPQIESLRSEKTFTVVTAHQPSLFTGPLYYIYKIVSAIKLTQRLNDRYPEYHFVPVFVSGGEDHDFEEVNHLHLFNQRIVWENEESGSVGMMQTASLAPVLAELKSILGDREDAQRIYQLIERTHTRHTQYSDAILELTHELFKSYGLVVLNMNDRGLKNEFKAIVKEEITTRCSEDLVLQASQQLEAEGFKPQATPRAINFFYLRDQIRERIVWEEGIYKVLNTEFSFTPEAMVEEIDQHPERFSPNVVMRPIYQEKILPNLAYVGGGGEIAYWLERKSQFAHFRINFPMLVRRDSVLWVDKGSVKKLAKLNLTIPDIFAEEETLVKAYVKEQADTELTLAPQKAELEQLYDGIRTIAEQVDPTLKKAVLAELAKQTKVIEQLEGRLVRAEKQKHETAIKQIRSLKQKLFPNNGLQERFDNFLSLYVRNGEAVIPTLLETLDPLDKSMKVIVEE